MNYLPLLICSLLLNNCQTIIGAQASDLATNELTPKEQSCFKWFETTSKQLPSIVQMLPQEDMAVYKEKLKITEFPEQVIRSRNTYVDLFIAQAKNANITLEYDNDTLKSAMLKMTKKLHTTNVEKPTDLLTARTYVYSTLLNPEEQTALRDGYYQNPEQAQQVTYKWSNLLVEELVKLNLVENTLKAKSDLFEELYCKKIQQLKKDTLKNCLSESPQEAKQS